MYKPINNCFTPENKDDINFPPEMMSYKERERLRHKKRNLDPLVKMKKQRNMQRLRASRKREQLEKIRDSQLAEIELCKEEILCLEHDFAIVEQKLAEHILNSSEAQIDEACHRFQGLTIKT